MSKSPLGGTLPKRLLSRILEESEADPSCAKSLLEEERGQLVQLTKIRKYKLMHACRCNQAQLLL